MQHTPRLLLCEGVAALPSEYHAFVASAHGSLAATAGSRQAHAYVCLRSGTCSAPDRRGLMCRNYLCTVLHLHLLPQHSLHVMDRVTCCATPSLAPGHNLVLLVPCGVPQGSKIGYVAA
jgi:hypothetical protein